jgi:hypothetical protein
VPPQQHLLHADAACSERARRCPRARPSQRDQGESCWPLGTIHETTANQHRTVDGEAPQGSACVLCNTCARSVAAQRAEKRLNSLSTPEGSPCAACIADHTEQRPPRTRPVFRELVQPLALLCSFVGALRSGQPPDGGGDECFGIRGYAAPKSCRCSACSRVGDFGRHAIAQS